MTVILKDILSLGILPNSKLLSCFKNDVGTYVSSFHCYADWPQMTQFYMKEKNKIVSTCS